jgi:thiamine diphosphokinase
MTAREIFVPGVQFMFHVKHSFAPIVALAAGGREPDAVWLQTAFSSLPVYCADRGAAYCLAAGIPVHYLLGDCDSTKCDVYSAVAAQGATVEIFPQAKDDTDLQLLLTKMPKADLLVSGIWGGRFDHLFSSIYSLLQYKLQHHCQVILADEQECMVLLDAYEEVEAVFAHPEQIEALSVLPLADTNRVSIANVVWPLNNALLKQLHAYAISNVLLAGNNKCTCSCQEGKVAFYIKWRTEKNEY